MGRPRSCHCGECAKCERADYMREWWRALSQEQRDEILARRRKPTSEENRVRYEQRKAAPTWDVRYRARYAVSNAIRDGRLERQPCEVCGEKRSQAHHDNYTKPLEVRWLCRIHHGHEHRLAV